MSHYCDNWVTKQLLPKVLRYVLFGFLAQTYANILYAREYKTVKRPVYGIALNTVNVRQKPSTAYKILGRLEKNQTVQVIGWYKKKWYHVIYKNKKAWIWSKSLRLKIKKAQAKPLKKPSTTLEVIEAPANLNQKAYKKNDSDRPKVYDRYQRYK
ncbi:MAG TPA: SH3 domain-containing protein [Oligoflexia bacterium]|nr:SH3 domain-containing protein [Oligoflexia bacterium]HMR23907.1 SH3 domain-containing protein [Oligoflexia bacterium]